jgi:hypothetical protein
MKSCSGKTKAGKPCGAAAGPGGLCFFHANPDRAKSLGQTGGLKNRRFPGVDLQVPDNMTAADLRRLEEQVLRALLAGEIPAREVAALVQIIQLIHRHQQSVDVEQRLTELEKAWEVSNTAADMSRT